MKYAVTVRHTSWVDMIIKAKTPEEAEEMAEQKYINCDYDSEYEDSEIYCTAEEMK